MPLYEYYCADCNGVFELLRPAKQASMDQPCPQCDEDAKRIVSREFAMFTYRDGYPRRIPDDGSFYHFGKRVSAPISGPSDGFSHPELTPPEPEERPSIEDIETYELLQEAKKHVDPEIRARVIDDTVRKEQDIKKRMATTKGTRTEERAKQAAFKAEREMAKKKVNND
jgi:putative FmdB family regulatory protein